ncbi:MAG TPA: glycosyltransferase family 4 protein [Thermodesulfovibrio thiophilus]|nr:glycosyltransferase family 4 protein [Thermodesulfovibrio thiophilus]HQA03406.1 glycosyltransferase family 4 protein [Thermodesulfovibrio thiophilus]
MKILHLIYDHINNPWIGGGGAVRAYEINKRLAMKGHEILTISGKYPDAEDYEEDNLRFNFLGSDKNYVLSVFSYVFKAIQYLKKHAYDFDIVIEDFAPWNPVFSSFFHKNVILQLHHKEGRNILRKYFILGLPFYLIEMFYPKLFSNIITVSNKTRDNFRVNSAVIPNGISEVLLYEKSLNHDYIAYIGRIDIYNKGLDVLLTAVKNIKIKILIAGKGKDENKLTKKIKNLNITNIHFIGFLAENKKVSFISKAKFLIMPSRFEGQGIVALEAASMGKPVIVSDIPELRWVVEAGFGISFKSEDATDLAEKINFLLQRDDLITEMGKRGIEYAKQFTWDRIAEKYEHYLLSLHNKFSHAENLSLKQR